jgi:hypothetical protein
VIEKTVSKVMCRSVPTGSLMRETRRAVGEEEEGDQCTWVYVTPLCRREA